MKSKRVIILVIVIAIAMLTLTACDGGPIAYGKEYKQVIYKSGEGFMFTGNNFVINDDFTYEETYKLPNDNYETFKGRYIMTGTNDLAFTRLTSTSFAGFKKRYEKEIEQLGISKQDYKSYIEPNITDKNEVFIYKDYVFKASSIIAAKVQTNDYALTELDGLYRFKGLLDQGRESVMKIRLNEIFLEEKTETEELIYTKKIGTCELNNDIITIAPIVALEGGDPNDAMKFLLADIVFPVKYQEQKDENGVYDDNKVIEYYGNVKVRVIVNSFYTLKDIVVRD